MKKLWILVLAGMCINLYAQKNNNKPNEDVPVLEPVETILNVEDEPLTIDTEKPSFPPLDFVNEVESSTGPEVIEELEKVKKEKEDLVKRIADKEENEGKLLKRIDELKNSKELLEKNLESAGVLIENLGKEKKELKSEISDLKEQVGKPVGSLFDGWVYSSKSGWIYTSPKIYPYAFSQNDGWLKYELGTDPRRVFYFKEDAWKVLNKQKNNKNDK